jgi:serpin B
MQKSKILIVLCALSAVLAAGCTGHKSPTAITTGPQVFAQCGVSYTAQDGNGYFAFDLYAQEKANQGNLFFSPFSVFSALSMTYEGAENKTAQEMQKVLYLQTNSQERWQGFQKLMAAINNPNKSYQLSVANNLWLQKDFTFLSQFLSIDQLYYGAVINTVDFRGAPSAAINTINNAVSNETNGKISNLLSPADINMYTILILTNAIYFNGLWQYQFDPAQTVPQNFYVTSSQITQPKMMHMDLKGRIEDYYGTASVLEIPYTSHEVSMFVFLPPQGSMAALEDSFTGSKFNSWMAARAAAAAQTTGTIHLALPKFTFNTTSDMGAYLQDLGMPSAFIDGVADFSGMTGKIGPFIQKVLQKAYVDVSESGTEAAAATAVIVGCTMCLAVTIDMTPSFIADHPFIFVLYDDLTNTILFIGRVNDPTAG